MSEDIKKFFELAGVESQDKAKAIIEAEDYYDRPRFEFISFDNINNVEAVFNAFSNENVIIDRDRKLIIALDKHEGNDWIRGVLSSIFAEERGLEMK